MCLKINNFFIVFIAIINREQFIRSWTQQYHIYKGLHFQYFKKCIQYNSTYKICSTTQSIRPRWFCSHRSRRNLPVGQEPWWVEWWKTEGFFVLVLDQWSSSGIWSCVRVLVLYRILGSCLLRSLLMFHPPLPRQN